MYKIGTRVETVVPVQHMSKGRYSDKFDFKPGMKGTVVKVEPGLDMPYAVVFDEPCGGHDFFGEAGHCQSMPENSLISISEVYEKLKFDIGDRVKLVDFDGWNTIADQVGAIGKVISCNSACGDIGVDFGCGFNGHDLSGKIEKSTGWWCTPCMLEKLSPVSECKPKHKFKAWKKGKKFKKNTTYFRLIKSSDGVDLVTVSEDGEPSWYILGITRDGCLSKYISIPESTNLALDEDGRILNECDDGDCDD